MGNVRKDAINKATTVLVGTKPVIVVKTLRPKKMLKNPPPGPPAGGRFVRGVRPLVGVQVPVVRVPLREGGPVLPEHEALLPGRGSQRDTALGADLSLPVVRTWDGPGRERQSQPSDARRSFIRKRKHLRREEVHATDGRCLSGNQEPSIIGAGHQCLGMGEWFFGVIRSLARSHGEYWTWGQSREYARFGPGYWFYEKLSR